MKTHIRHSNTIARRIRNVIAGALGLALVQTSLLAGGPALLQLPVDGVTSENHKACSELLAKKLGTAVLQGAAGISLVEDGRIQFILGSKRPVSLSAIRQSLKDTDFSLAPDEQLMLSGIARIEVFGVRDENKLAERLADKTGASATVNVIASKARYVSIVLQSHYKHTEEKRAQPLCSVEDVKHIVAEHGASFTDINWGVSPRAGGDPGYWFCRDPYGAERIEAPKTKVKRAAAKTAAPAK